MYLDIGVMKIYWVLEKSCIGQGKDLFLVEIVNFVMTRKRHLFFFRDIGQCHTII